MNILSDRTNILLDDTSTQLTFYLHVCVNTIIFLKALISTAVIVFYLFDKQMKSLVLGKEGVFEHQDLKIFGFKLNNK